MRSVAVILTAVVVAVPASLLAQQRNCSDTRNPKNLPPPSALLDSARAIAEWTPLGFPMEGMVFSLLYRERDSFPTIRPIDPNDDQAAVVLSGAMNPQKSKQMWAVRVVVSGPPGPTITLARATYCPPAIVATAPGARSFVVQRRAGDQIPAAGRRLQFVVEVGVSEDGAVTTTRMAKPSGVQEFDEQTMLEWQSRRFLPALLDGLPIESWYRSDGQVLRL
jgi:hypothetical protein